MESLFSYAPVVYNRPFGDVITLDPIINEYRPYQTQPTISSQSFSSLGSSLSAEIKESDTDYHIHVDLPGVEKKNLDIEITNRTLQIRAQRDEIHVKTDKVHKKERNFGKVQRSIYLPSDADIQTAKASLKDGVLCISFEKTARHKLLVV